MNEKTKELIKAVSDWDGSPSGAFNIREDGTCAGRQSTKNIRIESKTDNPGLNIYISSETSGEKVYIPACITHGNENDLVYNDFYVEEGADVIIVAGCGIHTDDDEGSRHNGIHRFFLKPGSKAKYIEKHLGTGAGSGKRVIDPVTYAELGDGSVLDMDTIQIGGVDKTLRSTHAIVGAGAKLVIRERILTELSQEASTDFAVELNGDGSGVDLVSRSVAKDNSHQQYHSVITGNAPCTGHSECDAILSGHGTVDAAPELHANCEDATLIHEAAIGKIAGEQILKLRTLGLSEQEAEQTIIEGFLV